MAFVLPGGNRVPPASALGIAAAFLFTSLIYGSALPTAQIVVHSASSQGNISPYIYGLGLEWLDNGNGILDASTGALRQDILNLLRPLQIPVWRFPGGILSDYYHWQDGIGAMSARPVRANPMDGTMHANNFGTDELIKLCQAENAEPIITANFGTGSLNEVLAWQAYFLSKGMHVRFWEIGNEIYLSEPRIPATIAGDDARIYKTPLEYASAFPIWAKALRSADPAVLVGAIAGTTNTSAANSGWLDTLLATAAADADFIALHNSFAPDILGAYDYSNGLLLWSAYSGMYAQAAIAGNDTQNVYERFLNANPASQGRIAITEHFPLFGSAPTQDQLLEVLDQSRTHGSALFTASLFHTYIRQKVWMANYNLTTSPWFGALVTDTPNGLIKTPTYYVYDLYRNHFGTTAISVDVTSPLFNTTPVGTVAAYAGLAYLDAIASRDSSGRIYLAVINRNNSASIDATIAVDGLTGAAPATVYSLQAAQVNAINGTSLTATTFPASVATRVSQWTPPPNWAYTFPPNSITILVW